MAGSIFKAILIGLSLVFIVDNQANAQCSNVVKERAPPKLSFEKHSTVTENEDTFYTFSTDSLEYISAYQLPDSSTINGTWLLFYNNNPDSILLRASYSSGVLHGEVHVYDYPGATLRSKNNYNMGKLHKDQYYYNRNGNLHLSSSYDDGTLHGEKKNWHFNGRLAQQGTYTNGLKQGAFFNWDSNGRITKTDYYIDGKNEGSSLNFKKGKLFLVHYFQNGELIKGVEYFLTPIDYSKRTRKKNRDKELEFMIKEEARLEDSLIFVTKYFPSGQLKSETSMILLDEDDCERIYSKTGEHKFWAEDGQLMRIEFYKKDNLIRTINY
jgi:antitoxin component YwqK of YwqJK toxin-antitoxin module